MYSIFIHFVYYGKVRIRLEQKSVLYIYNILVLLVSGKLANERKQICAVYVDIVWGHNHSTTDLQTLRSKDINKSTAAQVENYFEISLWAGKLSVMI